MNDRQRAKLQSYIAIRTVCGKDPNRALWSSLPAFTILHDQFLAKLSYCNACTLIQGNDTTGITDAKRDSRAKLTGSILEVAGALSAFALLAGDLDLAARADVEASDIERLPDAEVDDRATAFLTSARGLPAPAAGSTQPSAAGVGLTPGKLDLLETRIETYNLLLGSPRLSRGEKTAATANLERTIDEIDRLLDLGLDKLVLQFRTTDFYQEYKSARKIDDPATHPAVAQGAPPNAQPAQPAAPQP